MGGQTPSDGFREGQERQAEARRAERRTFGENLIRLMADRGLTTGEVAAALGVSPRTVARWRAGRALPRDGRTLRILARRLDVARPRLTNPARLGRHHHLNHSPDMVTPQDAGPFAHEFRLPVTERQRNVVGDLARARGITAEEALRWYLNVGRLFVALRRTAQVMDGDGFPEAYWLTRLLDTTELRGFRIEEIGDLEAIYP